MPVNNGVWDNVVLATIVLVLVTWAFLRCRPALVQKLMHRTDDNRQAKVRVLLDDLASQISCALQTGTDQQVYQLIAAFKSALSDCDEQWLLSRQVTRLVGVAMQNDRDQMAGHLIDSYRALHRVALKRQENLKQLIDQLTLVAFIALRGQRSHLSCRVLDQLFLLCGRTYARHLFEHSRKIMDSIGLVGTLALRRKEDGMIYDILNNMDELMLEMRRKEQDAGRHCWTELLHVHLQLLSKCVSQVNGVLLEQVLNHTREHFAAGWQIYPDELPATMREWADAAKLAVMTNHPDIANMIMVNLVMMVEVVAKKTDICRIVLTEIGKVGVYALNRQPDGRFDFLLFPVFELGRKWMNQEVKAIPMIAVDQSYRGRALQLLLDQLLVIGMSSIERGGKITPLIRRLMDTWGAEPENFHRHKTVQQFEQLWILYWLQNRRRAASRNPEAYPPLPSPLCFSPEQLKKFLFIDQLREYDTK